MNGPTIQLDPRFKFYRLVDHFMNKCITWATCLEKIAPGVSVKFQHPDENTRIGCKAEFRWRGKIIGSFTFSPNFNALFIFGGIGNQEEKNIEMYNEWTEIFQPTLKKELADEISRLQQNLERLAAINKYEWTDKCIEINQ